MRYKHNILYAVAHLELCATFPNTELRFIAIESNQLGSCTWIMNALSLSSKRQQAKDDNGDCKLILNVESNLDQQTS